MCVPKTKNHPLSSNLHEPYIKKPSKCWVFNPETGALGFEPRNPLLESGSLPLAYAPIYILVIKSESQRVRNFYLPVY